MKNISKLIFVATTAIAVISCQKESYVPVSPNPTNEIRFVLNAKMLETKTGISYEDGSYLPYWQGGDELGVLTSIPEVEKSTDLKNNAVFINSAAKGVEAAFQGSLSGIDGSEITLYSYYPASAVKKVYAEHIVGLDIPDTQHPIYDEDCGYSFDPQSDILVAKPVVCEIKTDDENQIDLYFTRISSVLRLELNMDEDVTGFGELVKSVQITTSNGNITGRLGIDLMTGEYKYTNALTNSKEVRAIFDNPKETPTYLGYTDANNNVFFSIAPCTIQKGSTLTFTIETVDPETGADAHKIVKTVSSSPEIAFESAKPTVFKLNIKEDDILKDEEDDDEDEDLPIYFNDFDKTIVSNNTTLTANTDVYKNEKGTGVENVTYSFAGDNSIRTTASSSKANFSGGNNIFFAGGTGHIFTIENIALSSENLQLTFAVNSATPENFKVTLSNNGVDWSNAIAYTLGPKTDSWALATADFTLPTGSETLYIRFQTDIASTIRLDDVKLDEGTGGQEISFDEGGNTDPGTDPEQPEQPDGGSYYVKITNTNELTSGDYLIVYETGNVAFDGSRDELDATSNTISVTINDSKIASNSTTDAAVFTYDPVNKTLKSASDYFIGRTSSSNGLLFNKNTPYTNDVSIDGDGNAMIKSSGGGYLRYNATGGQTRFRYYQSGQQAIQLYKKIAE